MQAIALVERPDHVSVRYRLAALQDRLAATGRFLALVPFAKTLLGRLRQFAALDRYDAVILQRTLLSTFELSRLRQHARRLVFDFDDAIWRRDSHARQNGFSRKRLHRFRQMVQAADTLVAGNEFLAQQGNERKTRIVPTCVDVRSAPIKQHAASGPLTMVWIGSASTLRSLEELRPTLEALGREFPGLKLRLICDRHCRFDPLTVEFVPWSMAAESTALAGADLGIAWMPADDWSRGKCGLKVVQYLAHGLPVVANPVGVHEGMVLHGRTGFLACGRNDWITAVRHLHDPQLRACMGREARQHACEHYSLDVAAAAWMTILAAPPLRAAC